MHLMRAGSSRLTTGPVRSTFQHSIIFESGRKTATCARFYVRAAPCNLIHDEGLNASNDAMRAVIRSKCRRPDAWPCFGNPSPECWPSSNGLIETAAYRSSFAEPLSL